MHNDYKPVTCSLYDVLELAALRQKKMVLTVAAREELVVVRDVYARGKEEFLDVIADATSSPMTIRLDRIEQLFDSADGRAYISDSH